MFTFSSLYHFPSHVVITTRQETIPTSPSFTFHFLCFLFTFSHYYGLHLKQITTPFFFSFPLTLTHSNAIPTDQLPLWHDEAHLSPPQGNEHLWNTPFASVVRFHGSRRPLSTRQRIQHHWPPRTLRSPRNTHSKLWCSRGNTQSPYTQESGHCSGPACFLSTVTSWRLKTSASRYPPFRIIQHSLGGLNWKWGAMWHLPVPIILATYRKGHGAVTKTIADQGVFTKTIIRFASLPTRLSCFTYFAGLT